MRVHRLDPRAAATDATRPARARIFGIDRDVFVRDAALALALAVVYFVAARLSLRLSLVGESVTPLWPPTGIAVVALLTFGYRVWPGITVAAFVVNATLSPGLGSAAQIAVGNTLAPVVAVVLLRRVGFRKEIDRLRDALAVVFAALAGMLLSATIGSASLVLGNAPGASDFGSTWAVWWAGDAMGVLVVAPFLLTLQRISPLRRIEPARALEAVALIAATTLVARAAIWSDLHVHYVVFPFLAWVAWRFRQAGAAPAALIVSSLAIWAAVTGAGAFDQDTLLGKMATLQVFNAGVAFTSFVLAAIMSERIQAREALERAGAELEERVRLRTAELSAANARLEAEIAERARVAGVLAKTGRQLEEAQKIAHIGSWEWDVAADRVVWSEELYRIYGVRPEEFEATLESYLRLVHHGDRDAVERAVRRAFEESEPFAFDHRIVRADGVERVLHAEGRPEPGPAGPPGRMFGTAQDITERRRAEDALRRFIANAAHELRTPLSSVSGLAALLAEHRDGLSPQEFDECLSALGRQGERARRLITDLLDLSRISHGPPESLAPVVLSQAARHAIQAAPTPEGVRLSVDVPEGLMVVGEPERLGQILVNLLTNAYRYGGPNVGLEAGIADGFVRLIVSDDGPGVPEEMVPHIFEPFSRAVATRGGSGLGLAIVHGIAEAFGGACRYERGDPSGARFVVTLRRAG